MDSPTADFTFATAGLQVQFQNQSTGCEPLAFFWDFGDGTSPWYRTQKAPTHTYNNPGTYNVTLYVTNAAGIDSLMKAVTVAL